MEDERGKHNCRIRFQYQLAKIWRDNLSGGGKSKRIKLKANEDSQNKNESYGNEDVAEGRRRRRTKKRSSLKSIMKVRNKMN